jgi:hypothetical protein
VIGERIGRWRRSTFGTFPDFPVGWRLAIVLYRGLHGWRAPDGAGAFALLPHQIYWKELSALTEAYGVREIVAVELHTGQWRTLWAASKGQISHAPKRREGTP